MSHDAAALKLGFAPDPDEGEGDSDLDDAALYQDAELIDEPEVGFEEPRRFAVNQEEQAAVLDVHTFAEIVPSISLPDLVEERRAVTFSILGVDVNRERKLMPALEYHAWDALCALEDRVAVSPLSLEMPVTLPFDGAAESTKLLASLSRFFVNLKSRMVEYLAEELATYEQTVYVQRQKSGIQDSSVETEAPPIRALSSSSKDHVAVDAPRIKALPTKDFIGRMVTCREIFFKQNVTLALLRSEMKYNNSRIIDFKFLFFSGKLPVILVRAFFGPSGDTQSVVQLTEDQLAHLYYAAGVE